jgi:hypothetical protein
MTKWSSGSGLEQMVNRRVVDSAACDGDFDMQSRSIQIEPSHVRAISREVAEGLRRMLPQAQPEPGSSLQKLINRLGELDEHSPSIIPCEPSRRDGNAALFALEIRPTSCL